MTPEELDEDEPVTFDGGVNADLTEGTIVFEFPEPREITNIKVDTPGEFSSPSGYTRRPVDLVIIPIKPDENGNPTEGTHVPLNEGDNPINPEETPDFDDVTSVIIRRADDEPLVSGDITNIEVVACAEGWDHYSFICAN